MSCSEEIDHLDDLPNDLRDGVKRRLERVQKELELLEADR